MEETGGPGEKHRPVTSQWPTLSHINAAHPVLVGIQTRNISGDSQTVIGTYCIGTKIYEVKHL
jgi:hypothetical protein